MVIRQTNFDLLDECPRRNSVQVDVASELLSNSGGLVERGAIFTRSEVVGFILDLVDYENKARKAVKAFLGKRAAATKKQVGSGKADQGERAGVTAGKNMDGFVSLIFEVIRANGLAHAQIHQKRIIVKRRSASNPARLSAG